jgi:hypothetical protein
LRRMHDSVFQQAGRGGVADPAVIPTHICVHEAGCNWTPLFAAFFSQSAWLRLFFDHHPLPLSQALSMCSTKPDTHSSPPSTIPRPTTSDSDPSDKVVSEGPTSSSPSRRPRSPMTCSPGSSSGPFRTRSMGWRSSSSEVIIALHLSLRLCFLALLTSLSLSLSLSPSFSLSFSLQNLFSKVRGSVSYLRLVSPLPLIHPRFTTETMSSARL